MVSKIFSLAAFAGAALAQTYSNSTTSPVSANGGNSTGSGSGTVVGAGSGSYGGGNSSTSTASYPAGTGATTSPATGLTNSSALATENAFCSFYSGKANRGYLLGGEIFKIDCGFAREGLILEIDITVITKRQTYTAEDLPDCINTCVAYNEDAVNDGTATRCLATSLNRDTLQCTFYSTIGAEVQPPPANVDYAQVISQDVVTGSAGSGSAGGFAGAAIPLTTTIVPASTTTYTIYSCAATVTDCPYRQVATSVVAAYTTVCPGNAATSGLASPVASGPYAAQVVTVYSASTSTLGNGATTTSYVAVDTQVINVASATATYPSNSVVLTTTIAPLASATSSGVVAFTGAAQHVEAGMGMAALIGAAALLI